MVCDLPHRPWRHGTVDSGAHLHFGLIDRRAAVADGDGNLPILDLSHCALMPAQRAWKKKKQFKRCAIRETQ